MSSRRDDVGFDAAVGAWSTGGERDDRVDVVGCGRIQGATIETGPQALARAYVYHILCVTGRSKVTTRALVAGREKDSHLLICLNARLRVSYQGIVNLTVRGVTVVVGAPTVA